MYDGVFLYAYLVVLSWKEKIYVGIEMYRNAGCEESVWPGESNVVGMNMRNCWRLVYMLALLRLPHNYYEEEFSYSEFFYYLP